MEDEINGLKQHSILSIGVLNLLGFARLLCLVQHCLQSLTETSSNHWII